MSFRPKLKITLSFPLFLENHNFLKLKKWGDRGGKFLSITILTLIPHLSLAQENNPHNFQPIQILPAQDYALEVTFPDNPPDQWIQFYWQTPDGKIHNTHFPALQKKFTYDLRKSPEWDGPVILAAVNPPVEKVTPKKITLPLEWKMFTTPHHWASYNINFHDQYLFLGHPLQHVLFFLLLIGCIAGYFWKKKIFSIFLVFFIIAQSIHIIRNISDYPFIKKNISQGQHPHHQKLEAVKIFGEKSSKIIGNNSWHSLEITKDNFGYTHTILTYQLSQNPLAQNPESADYLISYSTQEDKNLELIYQHANLHLYKKSTSS